jgi:subtilisin family serine protease
MRLLRFAVLTLMTGATLSSVEATHLAKTSPDVTRAEARARLAAEGWETHRFFPQIGWYAIRLIDSSQSARAAARALAARSWIKEVEREITWKAIGGGARRKPDARASEPTDPRYPDQFGHQRIRAREAWVSPNIAEGIIASVSDSGVDLDHEDLASQLWVNSDEIPGNGIDDDGNGYVDDIHGYDFANDDANPDDDNAHGTHVAGIIGAAANTTGVIGVAPNVKIMVTKFLDEDGSGKTSDGISTVLYSVDNGAQIINMSWGGGGRSRALRDALNYAVNRGVLPLAAAGNDTENCDAVPHFPSSYNVEGLVSVASSQRDGELSSFSNYGEMTVHLAAPGSDILSTWNSGAYRRISGTSMATPMVAGIAALMYSSARTQGLAFSPVEIRNLLMDATFPHAEYADKLITEGEVKADEAIAQVSDQTMRLIPRSTKLLVGRTFQFRHWPVQEVLTWSSSDETVATVDAQGVVTGEAIGEFTISALASDGNIYQATGVVKPAGPANGNPGCGNLLGADATAAEAGSTLLLPLLLSGFWRRRKIR